MKIVFFTGVGISVESGIPTFRNYKGNANEGEFETLLTLSYFKKHPEVTWK
jgi:NAD-dependent SIR2 family protein deacetylase